MSKYSKEGSRFVGSKIKKLLDEGMKKDQASAVAMSYARKKGLKVPAKKGN